ncbi:putative 3prime [Diplonema papillatum]|nr:putative 3prime [Diplonema papillatum]
MPSLESSDINASGHSEFGLLNSMTTADGALYYIRNACIEKVQLERAENESFVASPFILVAPEDSRLLQPRKGVPSYLTWENRTTHAERSIILDEDDSVAYPLHQSIQGTVVGLMSFSEGLHCWNLWFSDLQNVAFGVVSKMGVDSFYSCRSGAMPDYVACIKPNAFLEHRLHWKDSKGIEHWRTLDPPLSAYAKAADNEVSVVLDFYHKQITFLCNEKLVCTVSFNRRSDDHVGRGPLSPRDKHRSTPLLGDHTVFAHLKHGSRVKLIQKIKRVYDTLTSTMEGVPPPRIMAGNPYARWGIVDGQGTEAVFTLPLGLCHWNDCVWVTDCNAVNVEHCKTVGRALDLILSTPNIYQVEYVGGALDDDVARYLSDTYAPQGIVWEEEADADGTPTAAVRRRSSCVNFNSRNSQTKLIEKDKKSAATVRFDDAPSKALGIELLGLDSLDFNVFDVNRLCDDSGGVLVQVAMNVFSRYRFFPRYFGTPELVHRLIQFFSKIQAGYHRENYYHNHIHAADVLQTVHWLINTSGVVEKISDVDCFSVLLSAVIHDYDHPGVSNAFLVNSKDDIALHFNDQSVLENHHLFLSFQLLRVESYSILESFTEHEQKIIRESMITHVFGTDMKNHFKSLGELKARQQALRDEGGDFSASPDDKILLLKSMLHAADISNPVKYKAVYLEWTKRVMKEFREQGKRESDLEMAISPFCDSEADVAKCQKGFIEFVVRPLQNLRIGCL